jgi:hypothetical protein
LAHVAATGAAEGVDELDEGAAVTIFAGAMKRRRPETKTRTFVENEQGRAHDGCVGKACARVVEQR